MVGAITAALEKHAAHAVPSQTGSLGVGMQAASGIFEATAAQHADHIASAASADCGASAIAVEVSSLVVCKGLSRKSCKTHSVCL